MQKQTSQVGGRTVSWVAGNGAETEGGQAINITNASKPKGVGAKKVRINDCGIN